MKEDRSFQKKSIKQDEQSKSKDFWKKFGIISLSVVLAIITVVVMNLG